MSPPYWFDNPHPHPMTRFAQHYFSSHTKNEMALMWWDANEKRNGIDVMGCGPKGIKLRGCKCASTMGGGGEKGGFKHEPKTWESAQGCLGLNGTVTMCCSNNVGACKVPRVGCNVICRITSVVGLAYQGKDIVFRFIIEYNSLMDFGP
jgi:hypothetical protein